MKKLLLAMICALSFINSANAVIVTEEVYVNHTTNNQIIGKKINGCKIIDTYIKNNGYYIVCVKDGKLYRSRVQMYDLERDCNEVFCYNDYSKKIVELLNE